MLGSQMRTRFFPNFARTGPLSALFLSLFVWTGCDSSQVSFPAPSWTLQNLEGQTVSSEAFEGKVVILDFWATWCPPCREEIPGFIELQKQYGADGLVVVGVAYDQEGAKVVAPFVEKTGINYPVLLGTEEMADRFGGIEGFPTTFIIDRQSQVVARHVGYRPKSVFEKEIQPLLSAH